MNEEKIPNEENTKEELTITKKTEDPQKTKETEEENVTAQKLKSSQENIEEQTNGVSSKNIKRSSANIGDVSNVKEMVSKTVEDDDQLLEALSGRSTYLPYFDEDELINMYYEDEFESDEEWITDRTKPLTKHHEFFDPNQDDAVKLETDTQTLVISKLPRLEPTEEPSSTERIFDISMFSDISLDTLTSQPSFEQDSEGRKCDKGKEFFENLGEVPEVKDIKSDASAVEDYKARFYVKDYRSSVGGRFVDPLTGVSTYTMAVEETKDESQEILEKIEEEVEEEEELSVQEFEFDDFDSCYPDDLIEKSTKVTVKDETEVIEEMFVDERPSQFRDSNDIDEKQEDKDKTKIVESFFESLIKNIVQYCEQIENQQKVMKKLDKKLVFYEIEKLVREYILEKNVQMFLSRKVVNYYRRKRQMRYILPEKSEFSLQDYERYNETAEYLNSILGREIAMIRKTSKKIDDLFIEVDEMEEMEREERLKFENLVRNTFKRENMPKLQEAIEKDLKQMADLAEEISEVRAVHISRQHTLGTLKAQISELENIGNGLSVGDYENIDRETVRLEKKIEEHNAELQKYYRRFRSTIHTLAHSKLRNEMFVDNIKKQASQLSILLEEETGCRLHIYNAKMNRRRLLRDISEISFQSGLLDKPAILVDYDQTLDLLEKKRKEVKSLRETYKSLEQKFKRAEALSKQKKIVSKQIY